MLQLSSPIVLTFSFPNNYAKGSIWRSPPTVATINCHTTHIMPKSYFAPVDFEPCVKLDCNLSTAVVPPKHDTASRNEERRIYTFITCEWLWIVSVGEEIHCFPTAEARSLFHSRIIFQGCSSFSYFITFDCTSRALASSPSSRLAKAFELWQCLSWNFQCLKLGTGLKPFTKSLWVVAICKNYEPGTKVSSSSSGRRAIKHTQQYSYCLMAFKGALNT